MSTYLPTISSTWAQTVRYLWSYRVSINLPSFVSIVMWSLTVKELHDDQRVNNRIIVWQHRKQWKKTCAALVNWMISSQGSYRSTSFCRAAYYQAVQGGKKKKKKENTAFVMLLGRLIQVSIWNICNFKGYFATVFLFLSCLTDRTMTFLSYIAEY